VIQPKFPFCSWLVAVPVLGVLTLAVPATAQTAAPGTAFGQISSRLTALNLTPDQQSRVNALIATEQSRFIPLRKALRQAEMAFVRAGATDAGATDAAAQEIGDATKNVAVEIGNLRAGIAEILTPTQQAQLQSAQVAQFYRRLLTGGMDAGTGGGRGHAAGAQTPYAQTPYAQTPDAQAPDAGATTN